MPGRTSTERLDRGPVSVRRPTWRGVASLDERIVRPVTMRVDARALASGRTDEEAASMVGLAGGAGVWWNYHDGVPAPWDGGAALRIVYGSVPGIRRTIYADLRAGDYALPPCNAVEVSAAYWNPTDSDADDLGTSQLEVSVELADGDCADASPLRVSCVRSIPGVDTTSCMVPPGAYAWDVYAPDVSSYFAQCGPLQASRTATTWAPPTHPYIITGPDSHRVRVWPGDGVDGAWLAGLVFYVR